MTNSISGAPLDAERAPVAVVARAALGAQAAVPRVRPWRGMVLTVLACGFLAAGLAEAAAQTSGIEEEVSRARRRAEDCVDARPARRDLSGGA